MEIVICLLKEAIQQYESGNVAVGDKCLYFVEMVRAGDIQVPNPVYEIPLHEWPKGK